MATEVNAANRQRAQETLAGFVAFAERHRWVVRVNTVNFFTEGLWDAVVAPYFGPAAEAVARLPEADMARLPAGELPPQAQEGSSKADQALRDFIQDCLRHRLESTDILCDANAMIWGEIGPGQDVTSSEPGPAKEDELEAVVAPPKILMSLKKSHEIAAMSGFAARLAKSLHLQKVIDLGSGKGYLGQHLHQQYGLDVIGVDSSDSNTQGALVRNHKLSKRRKGGAKAPGMNIQQGPGPAHPAQAGETFREVLSRRAARRKQLQTFGKTSPPSESPSEPADLMNMQEANSQSKTSLESSTLQMSNEHSIPAGPQSAHSLMNMQQAGGQSEASLDSSTLQAANENSVPAGTHSRMNMQQQSVDQSATESESLPASEWPPNRTGEESDIQMSQLIYSSGDSVQQMKNVRDLGCRELTDQLAALAVQPISQPEPNQRLAEHLENISVDSDDNCEDPVRQPSTKTTQAEYESYKGNDEDSATDETSRGGPSFSSVTAFVEPGTSLSAFLSEKSKKLTEQSSNWPFLLVGLHTCGDLAASTLRLFVRDSTARALLNVGCCYQHLTEEFEPEGWCLPVPPTRPEAWGFPMSSYLRSQGTHIMRPGRMLASMAADRIATSRVVPAMGLFYRSVLQVLLKDHYRLPTRSENVGKLAPKCRSFLEYARKALKKLKFDDSKLSDAEIQAYSDRFQPYYPRLQALNQLRVALSPTIEGVFMLDRLCYLQEQEGIHRAAVIRLFDPVTSPRCYGILATRK